MNLDIYRRAFWPLVVPPPIVKVRSHGMRYRMRCVALQCHATTHGAARHRILHPVRLSAFLNVFYHGCTTLCVAADMR